MVRDRGAGSILFDIFNHFFLILLAIIWLYPMARVISLSFSDPLMIQLNLVSWFPKGFNLDGYKFILSYKLLWRAYLNTVLYAGVGTFISILFTSMIAYSLSIKTFVLRKALTIYLAITMFFSGGLIPTYLLIRSLGMLNTFWVMVIPGSISAYTVVVFRTFFQNHPDSLRESAFMDGANDIIVLFLIILPISKALLATFALFTIVSHWNAWFNALIYLNDENMFNLQLILRRIVVVDTSLAHTFSGEDPRILAIIEGRMHPKNLQNAMIVVVMLPIVFLFPYAQKYFLKGLIVGSLKG